VNCDSQYKFYGPHLGVLYGKYDLLDRLHAYKVRPAPDDPPGKADRLRPSETGTHPSGTTKGSRGHLQR
jgi:selenocysteine lyase/cysteine desulfurase